MFKAASVHKVYGANDALQSHHFQDYYTSWCHSKQSGDEQFTDTCDWVLYLKTDSLDWILVLLLLLLLDVQLKAICVGTHMKWQWKAAYGDHFLPKTNKNRLDRL